MVPRAIIRDLWHRGGLVGRAGRALNSRCRPFGLRTTVDCLVLSIGRALTTTCGETRIAGGCFADRALEETE